MCNKLVSVEYEERKTANKTGSKGQFLAICADIHLLLSALDMCIPQAHLYPRQLNHLYFH